MTAAPPARVYSDTRLARSIREAPEAPTLAGEGSGREWRTRGGEAASQSEFERTIPPPPALAPPALHEYSALVLQPRIEHVAQPVAQQVHGEHREHDADPGECRDPPRLAQVVAPLGE